MNFPAPSGAARRFGLCQRRRRRPRPARSRVDACSSSLVPSAAEEKGPSAAVICSSVGRGPTGRVSSASRILGQMLGHGAAATADDPRAGVARQHRVFGHQIGRAVIVDMPIDIFRDTGIALGDDRPLGAVGKRNPEPCASGPMPRRRNWRHRPAADGPAFQPSRPGLTR